MEVQTLIRPLQERIRSCLGGSLRKIKRKYLELIEERAMLPLKIISYSWAIIINLKVEIMFSDQLRSLYQRVLKTIRLIFGFRKKEIISWSQEDRSVLAEILQVV